MERTRVSRCHAKDQIITFKNLEIVKDVVDETKIFHGVRLINDESQNPNHVSLSKMLTHTQKQSYNPERK